VRIRHNLFKVYALERLAFLFVFKNVWFYSSQLALALDWATKCLSMGNRGMDFRYLVLSGLVLECEGYTECVCDNVSPLWIPTACCIKRWSHVMNR
jgi:hypothetical protein